MSLGHRKTMGNSIGISYENVSGAFSYKKKAGKVDIETSVRASNSVQQGQLEGSSYFSAPQMTRVFMSPWHQINNACLLYTSDAADDSLRVDLGGRRIIKKSYL